MNEFTVVTVLLAAVLVAALARRVGWNSPLVILGVGLAASFLPGLEQVEVPSELILGIVLPPLLYSAALSSSYQDFRASIQPIARLGVGLVIVTTVAVGAAAHLLDPKLGPAAALLLGAVVAPPDAVAASAVGRRLGLPRRVMTLLGGESLINDATSLTLYRITLAAIYTTTSLAQGLVVFALATAVGVAVGMGLAYLAQIARSGLRDPTVDTVIGLMLPFVAYWIAEEYQGSGVLAVVSAGFFIGQAAPRTTVATRLHEEPIWASLDLMLESFTFALIGLQLRWVIKGVSDSPNQSLGAAVVLSLVVLLVALAVRPVYIYGTELLVRSKWIRRRRGATPYKPLTGRELLVTSWAGMRGVVTLAAATAIPLSSGGRPFAERATIQLAAYTVAIGTLLIQGLTLPALIRALKISGDDETQEDDASEARVRLLATRAASAVVRGQVDAWSSVMGRPEAERIATWATQGLLARETAAATLMHPDAGVTDADLATMTGAAAPSVIQEAREVLDSGGPDELDRAEMRQRAARLTTRIAELRTQMVRAQRSVVVAERNAGRLNETVMRRIMRELDLEEEAMAASWANRL
ncbi:MAG: sodium:proton antiporter [Bifidobacteriaceae bacterium]|jgi:CPA1 family monovalent cation:H+ antiporter|nr:sodium:proton antiporter [Bifidobacteriaceae bacterium]